MKSLDEMMKELRRLDDEIQRRSSGGLPPAISEESCSGFEPGESTAPIGPNENGIPEQLSSRIDSSPLPPLPPLPRREIKVGHCRICRTLVDLNEHRQSGCVTERLFWILLGHGLIGEEEELREIAGRRLREVWH